MEKHELANLASRIQEIKADLSKMADHAELEEFLTIIHKPGWTTVAEATFVKGIVDSMGSHTKAVYSLRSVLLAGARAVSVK